MASPGTSGTNGHLKGRSRSGIVLRSIITEAETMIKAARVPILTSCTISLIGTRAAIIEAAPPTTNIPFTGVLNFSCTFENTEGSRPSLDMAKNILVCPKRLTSSTEVILQEHQPKQLYLPTSRPLFRANATGAAVFLKDNMVPFH
jgi:hypothetical protein